MKKIVLLAGLVLLATLATVAYSLPTSLGPTGILNVPTADTVGAQVIEAQLAYDKYNDGTKIFPTLGVSYGLPKGEVGLLYDKYKDDGKVVSLHGKYVFMPVTAESPGVAAGFVYLKPDDGKMYNIYVVGTKALNVQAGSLAGSLGLLYQKVSDGVSLTKTTGMFGLAYKTAAGTYIGADYILKDIRSDKGRWGLVVRHPITPAITGQIGTGTDSRIFIGVIYGFAPASTEQGK